MRRQRSASINYDDENLLNYVEEFLICLKNANYLIKKYSPKLLILSHAVNFDCGALAWIHLKNINTVILYESMAV